VDPRGGISVVAQASLEAVNQKLEQAAMPIRLAVVPLDQCRLVEKNARWMPAEQYRRLVENIRRDGCLTSVPFAVREDDGHYTILSGNHRVQAARDAGLAEILLLYTDKQLSRQERVAIQLSHNAIVGQDDLAILRELYDELTDLELRAYSGLDDVTLGRMDPSSLESLSDVPLDCRVVSIMFLPNEVERAKALFETIWKKATGDETWINRFADYDRFLDTLAVVRERAGVKNTATAFSLMLDVVEQHLDEIPPRDKGDNKAKKQKA